MCSKGGNSLRNVILEDRSWSADDVERTEKARDRRDGDDPVAAAGVDYGYARI